MRINIVTLFPEWFTSPLETALLGKAREAGLVDFRLLNPRDRAEDRHHIVDDRPYGGGPGMVMMLEPLVKTLRELQGQGGAGRIIMLAAAGKPLTQSLARELAREETLTLVCGRYEGIDARLMDILPVEQVSVGEAVLNGGEAAAMMLVEAGTRLIPGFMGKEESGDDESFSAGLLEYPHFTRPEVFEGVAVPEILRSGDHARIAAWRRQQSLRTTLRVRPDMLDATPLAGADMAYLRQTAMEAGRLPLGRNLHCALVHYPVYLGDRKTGATSLTNLDVHDIARCSRTYGLGSFTVVTPLKDQQAILETLVRHWTDGPGGASNPDRAEAFRLVGLASDVREAIDSVEARTGQRPVLLGTSARDGGVMTPQAVRDCLLERPVLLLFGTGHGLAPEVLDACDGVLRPLRWMDEYNHLPVRGAVAITLDRVLGDCC
ncbi:tRNA (guanosine(37)-N1)-methyltransferase TrmD [uncultured Bilophila sp.]|uniref:tRNA (guanosine(37)-N1)-methyltransferase TrmD n=1 Tax=uncultured Bilophila sp. TaxID=529385 RepID=UPI002623CC5C|nr:tRNA (guanosine(37)-N1)-methyltransferase TrmD [uncultured Bilophila sp.]